MNAQEPIYDIYFDLAGKYIVMDWNGYATSDQFRKGTELMLDMMRKYKAGKVLADTSDMVLIGSQDQEWLVSDFIPRALNHGFYAIALIKPGSYFNQVALNAIAERIQSSMLQMRIFDDEEQARSWLLSI